MRPRARTYTLNSSTELSLLRFAVSLACAAPDTIATLMFPVSTCHQGRPASDHSHLHLCTTLCGPALHR